MGRKKTIASAGRAAHTAEADGLAATDDSPTVALQQRIAAWRAGGEPPRLTADRAALDVVTLHDLGDAHFRRGWR